MEQPLIPLAEVPDSGTVTADFFGRPVLVTKVDGKPRAFVDSCPHFGGPLVREGDKLVCGWHKAEFALDGRCLKGPARADSRAALLPTRVIDGKVTFTYSPPDGTPGAHEDESDLATRLAALDG